MCTQIRDTGSYRTCRDPDALASQPLAWHTTPLRAPFPAASGAASSSRGQSGRYAQVLWTALSRPGLVWQMLIECYPMRGPLI